MYKPLGLYYTWNSYFVPQGVDRDTRCFAYVPYLVQVILAGTLTGVQGDIRCKVLAALSTAKYLELELS